MQNQVIKLALKFIISLFYHSALTFFVLALVTPIAVILVMFYSADYQPLFDLTAHILFFPAYFQEKDTILLPDALLAFTAWGIILSALAKGLQWLTHGRFHVPSAHKVLHRIYLAVYLVLLAVVPFMRVSAADSRGGLVSVFLFLFVLG